ncbi:MAG: hypothetical protein QM817_35280 [Archangium sp.]
MLLSVLLVLAAAPVTLPAPLAPYENGVLTPPLIGTPEEAALRFANSRKAELGIDQRTQLISVGAFSTRFGGSVHLAQTINGLRIYGRKVIVTFDTAQRVVRVSNTVVPFTAAKLDTTISLQDAIALAAPEVEGAWLKRDGTPWGGAKKLAFFVNGEVHVGFVTFIPTLKHSENWHVAIDGTDGTVLWKQNRAWANDGAQVYATSPGGLQAGVGVTATTAVTLEHLTDAGTLIGDRIRALNCCPTANCDPDAGPARVQGSEMSPQGTVDFDVAICDQKRRATNDPMLHPSGDFTYAPVDPPGTAAPSVNNPADWDEFAEVHGYYHVSKAYEAIRQLSIGPLARDGGFSPFDLRTADMNGPLDLLTVWVNVSDPDFANAMPNASGVYVANSLSRTDNAMFLAHENMDLLLLPPQVLTSDALVIYQGQNADFAYDGPVLWHEFGHGVIHSTADWDTVVTFDQRSSNNESSALHEGVSDLLSAMTGKRSIIGEYVGPRITPGTTAIRDVNNQERCPDVLWGESHQDSLHFTGAVWQARSAFLGTDNGSTFDSAFYAAIVSFPPDVGFERAAQIITDSVVAAFPAVTDARMQLDTIFTARGVKGCSKVLDVTTTMSVPRVYFNIPGTAFAGVSNGLTVPGPYQFKIHVPNGAKSVTMSAQMQTFGTNSRLEFLASANNPISFAKSGVNLSNDAMAKTVPTVAQQVVSGTVMIDVPCGGDLHFAIGDTSQRDRTLFNLTFTYAQADSCPEVDAGVPDAGMTMMPNPTVRLVAAKEELGARVMGCTCSSASPFALVIGALWLLRRRASKKA